MVFVLMVDRSDAGMSMLMSMGTRMELETSKSSNKLLTHLSFWYAGSNLCTPVRTQSTADWRQVPKLGRIGRGRHKR